MKNDAGEIFNFYRPRKCSSWNRIIHAKDQVCIQVNIVDVIPQTRRMLETLKVYAICGEIRRMGEADDYIVRLAKKDGLTKNH